MNTKRNNPEVSSLSPAHSGQVLHQAKAEGLFNFKPLPFSEKDFDDLRNYCKNYRKEFCRPNLTDYFFINLRAMLRQFPKEEIKTSIDIMNARGHADNWAKYLWGILWKRKKEGKTIYEISKGR